MSFVNICYDIDINLFGGLFMDNKKAVVSLGHEALGYTTNEQKEAVSRTAKALADLAQAGYQLTITHSNGPQVSMIHKAMTELHRIYIDYTPAPMSVCSAMSQGYVGYDIQSALHSELEQRGISKTVTTVLTQVTVDPYDEAFYSPTKVIGRYMSKEDAETQIKKGNYVKEVPGKGYLRIVAAPKPINIVELDAIKLLADAGVEVIACGGGGIPVLEQEHKLKGASAVIEKDAIAGKLAADLKADRLVILTSVPCVYTSFGKEDQAPIEKMTIAKAKEYIEAGEFGEGDMLPKIEAAIQFLEANPEGSVLITSLDHVSDALKGRSGTFITA
jgi:carbamate kinase